MSADNRDKLKQALRHFENFLEGRQYFVGANPTIADISILSNIIQLKNAFGGVIGNYSNLNEWFKRCESLPGFEENLDASKIVAEYFKHKEIKLLPLE